MKIVSEMDEALPLGEFIAEELEARGWDAARPAAAIGDETQELRAIRQLEIELVIACSADRNCYSTIESLKCFARGLNIRWQYLAAIQNYYRQTTTTLENS